MWAGLASHGHVPAGNDRQRARIRQWRAVCGRAGPDRAAGQCRSGGKTRLGHHQGGRRVAALPAGAGARPLLAAAKNTTDRDQPLCEGAGRAKGLLGGGGGHCLGRSPADWLGEQKEQGRRGGLRGNFATDGEALEVGGKGAHKWVKSACGRPFEGLGITP